jgi:hypothetical protein
VVEREHVRDREEALEPACRLPADLLTYWRRWRRCGGSSCRAARSPGRRSWGGAGHVRQDFLVACVLGAQRNFVVLHVKKLSEYGLVFL